MRRIVYVLGGYLPNGGAYMFYTIGRILYRHFGFDCRVVDHAESPVTDSEMFDYPDRFDRVGIDVLEREMSSRDLLVLGAAFSPYGFGLRLPGKKLMCIFGYTTFGVLDGFCDYYVCNSTFVQRFVQSVYGFAPPVIPRFVDLEQVRPGAPWHERSERALLVHGKKHVAELTHELRHRMALAHPDLDYELVPTHRESHRAFLKRLQHYRYYLTLSPAEGFGLPPLEAMASGCCVVGFHGNGGLEYMRPGVNCDVSGYPRLDAVADAVADLLRHPNRAEALARQGQIDAQGYGYETAHARWITLLDGVVTGTAPRGPGVTRR